MKLNNTTPDQDRVIARCISFGGDAETAAEIIQSLDDQLTEAQERIKELESNSRPG